MQQLRRLLQSMTATTFLLSTLCPMAGASAPHTTAASSKSSKQLYRARISTEVQEGDKLLAGGKYPEAAEFFRQALNKDSRDVPARVGLGMADVKQFQLDAAGEQFDKALTEDQKNALAHCGKALCAVYRLQSSSMTVIKNRASYLSMAEKECSTALDIDPQLPEAHYTLGLVQKEEGNIDKAQRSFEGATKLDPKFSDAFSALGQVNLQQNNTEMAEANFNKAISLNSGNSSGHYGLAQVYLKKGMTDKAIAELNTSLYQNRNSAPVHLALGRAYEAQGNTVAALKEYQDSIRIKPENASAYLGVANIRESRGDLEHAIADLRSGLELSPNNPELNLRIGNDSLKVEKLDDAIKSYENVLNYAPRSVAAADGLTRAYYLKAAKETSSAFVSSNDYEQADRSIARAIQLNPNSLQLRLAQAKLRSLSGRQIDLASLGAPQNDGERISYAEALMAQNRFDEAAQQMNIVIGNTSNAKDLFAVGDLAMTIKDLNSAEVAYRKGSTISGGEERAERGLAAVNKARDAARQNVTLGEDLARRKQLASAIDQYKAAIYADPRRAVAREDLAEALEKLFSDSPRDLREASRQYRAFLTLDQTAPVKEREKIEKRITKLEAKAYRLEEKNRLAKR